MPKSRECFLRVNVGLPTGREPYGNGAPIVVRGRESRPHGEGGQVFSAAEYRGMRNAESPSISECHLPQNTGEPDDAKVSRPVREGADGKVS